MPPVRPKRARRKGALPCMISVLVNTWLVEIPGTSIVDWIVQLGSADKRVTRNLGNGLAAFLHLHIPPAAYHEAVMSMQVHN